MPQDLIDDNLLKKKDKKGKITKNKRKLTCSEKIPVQSHGPLARYIKLRVVHAPGMPGKFSPPQRVRDPDMHHRTCVTHVL